MKKMMLSAFILLMGTFTSKAIDIKLYIATVERTEGVYPRYNLQLVICNNLPDTVYIKRDDLEMIYPQVTNDLSEINNGGSFYFIHNVRNMITDMTELRKHTIEPDWRTGSHERGMRKELAQENNKLAQKNVQGSNYYMIMPNKCITLYSYAQSVPVQLFKLHNVDKDNDSGMMVNLVVPVKYFTSRDNHVTGTLLISRDSDDMKVEMLKTRR